jgi:DNA polymerase elongation subunit (family B)
MEQLRRYWLTIIEKGQDDRTVLIFARDASAKRERFIVTDYMPYFYVDADSPLPNRTEIVDVQEVDPNKKQSVFGGPIVKIVLNRTKVVPYVRDWFHTRGLMTYEADILYPLRFRIDRQIYEGFTVPDEVFKRKPMTYDGKRYVKMKEAWWMKPFVPVHAAEVAGF